MTEHEDRLERAFEALRAQSRGRAKYDVPLEERIMQEFVKVRSARRRRLTALAAAVALLAASGLGIAAAGGIDAVKGWFGAIEVVGPDGQTRRFNIQGTELLDENGDAVGQLEPVPGVDGFTIRLDGPDPVGRPLGEFAPGVAE